MMSQLLTMVQGDLFKVGCGIPYQGDQQHWNVPGVLGYTGIFLGTGICNGNLRNWQNYWDVLGKFYFDKEKIFV